MARAAAVDPSAKTFTSARENRLPKKPLLAAHIGKSDKAEVHSVQHQLNGHEERDDVALENKSRYTHAEEHGAEREVPGNRDHQCSFLARTTAPIMAISTSTEVTSKGRRK